MSHEYPESQQPAPAGQGPSARPAPAAAGPAALSPVDAERSRRWRLVLGCSEIFLGLVCGFYGYVNGVSVAQATSAINAAGGSVPESAMAAALTVVALFWVLAAAYAGIGIWSIVARKSTAKGPLVAAIVLAAVAIVLIGAYLASRPAGVPQIGALALNVLIIVRAAVILRMRRVPAHG